MKSSPLLESTPFERDPVAQAILREGLSIQDRFSAAPVYATTGKGYLKSAGIDEIARIKDQAAKPKEP